MCCVFGFAFNRAHTSRPFIRGIMMSSRIRSGGLAEPAIFDGRNLYDPAAVEEAGLAYYGIGRGRSLRAPR